MTINNKYNHNHHIKYLNFLYNNIYMPGILTNYVGNVRPIFVSVLLVGGGSGGGQYGSKSGNGGNGGQVRLSTNVILIQGTTYNVSVGLGGIAGTTIANGTAGGNTTFTGLTSASGGSIAGFINGPAGNGGSNGNTPSATPGTAGSGTVGGAGANGITNNWSGTPYTYGAGGGGGGQSGGGTGGINGGGSGAADAIVSVAGSSGLVNGGGGGGGGSYSGSQAGKNGGNGLCIMLIPLSSFNSAGVTSGISADSSTNSGYRYVYFTGSGSYRA